MRDDTILVSIMHVNNEIGVVQDIAAIGEMCRARGIIYHVDATQSVGKLPIDLSQLKVDRCLSPVINLWPERYRCAVCTS